MIEKLKHIIKTTHKYNLVGIHNSTAIVLTIDFVKNELIVNKKQSFNHLDDEFLSYLKDSGLPLILNYEGDLVISKIVPRKTGYRNELLFKANLEDFYFYEVNQGQKVLVSVVRKQSIDELVSLFNTNELYILDISLGPFIVSSLLEYLKNERVIICNQKELTLQDLEIRNITTTKTTKNYSIEGETYSNKELPLIATFYNYKLPSDSITFDNLFIETNKTNYRFKTFIKKLVITSVFVLLSLILISHFAQDYYVTKLAEKQMEFSFASQQKTELNKLKKNKALKMSILKSIDVYNKNYIAKYILDIGNSVKAGITLNTVNYLPLKKKVRPKEKVAIQSKVILVEGENYKDAEFNNWITVLEKINWVKKIDIIEYNQTTSVLNTFKLKISL